MKLTVPITVQIDCVKLVKESITEFMDGASFSEDTTEDYLDGFYDFGNAIVSVLEGIENGQKFE